MEIEKKEVRFAGTVSDAENCLCDCCHGYGTVLKMEIPQTMYFNGRWLTTQYHNAWICQSCAEKLTAVLSEICGRRLKEAQEDGRD